MYDNRIAEFNFLITIHYFLRHNSIAYYVKNEESRRENKKTKM